MFLLLFSEALKKIGEVRHEIAKLQAEMEGNISGSDL